MGHNTISTRLITQNSEMRTLLTLSSRNTACRILSVAGRHNRPCVAPRCLYATDSTPPDTPLKYSKSAAADFSTLDDLKGEIPDAPWYQPISVTISLAAFLVYFLMLREENDLDASIQVVPELPK